MTYLLLLAAEVLAAALLLAINLFLLRNWLFHKPERLFLYWVFTVYLASVYFLVGLPNILLIPYLSFRPNIHWIPFSDPMAALPDALPNILLFLPLGFLLPLLRRDFREAKNTLLFGFAMSLTIECLQMFTGRATDSNDLLSNLAGTLLGFAAVRLLFPHAASCSRRRSDLFPLFALTIALMFFVYPFLSTALETYIL